MVLKKFGLGAVIAVAMLGMLSGCKAKTTLQQDTGNGSSGQSVNAPMEISIAHWDVETALSNGENDRILKTLQDKFNVKFVPKNITWDDYSQKIQAWAASDSLPDIFSIDAIGTSYFHEWISQGVVKALPENMSSYPNLEKYLDVDDIQALKKDGRLYCIPRKTYEDNYWNAKDRIVMYRWDLAQKAGVAQEPKTWDEFRSMMKKIIAADPEGKKIAGLTSAQPTLLDGFLFTYSLPAAMSDGSGSDYKWMKKDGRYIPAYFAGDAEATFQLARDMYQEGTIEADIALAKTQQSYDKFLNGQSAAILIAAGAQGVYNSIPKDWGQANDGRDFWDDVKILPLLPGADGSINFSIFRTSWSESYISNKVDDIKLAKILALYDYLLTDEGRALISYGFEGEDYKVDGEKLYTVDGVIIHDKYLSTRLKDLVEWPLSAWDTRYPSQAGTDERYREADLKIHDQAVKFGTMPDFDMRITYLSTPLKDKFIIKPADDLLNIMMGDKPVDLMYAELLKNYESKGLTAMIDEVNAKAEELGYSK